MREIAESFISQHQPDSEKILENFEKEAVFLTADDVRIFPAQTALRTEAMSSIEEAYIARDESNLPAILLLELPKDQLFALMTRTGIDLTQLKDHLNSFQDPNVLVVIDGCNRLTTAYKHNSKLAAGIVSLQESLNESVTIKDGERTTDIPMGKRLIEITFGMLMRTIESGIFSIKDLVEQGSLR